MGLLQPVYKRLRALRTGVIRAVGHRGIVEGKGDFLGGGRENQEESTSEEDEQSVHNGLLVLKVNFPLPASKFNLVVSLSYNLVSLFTKEDRYEKGEAQGRSE